MNVKTQVILYFYSTAKSVIGLGHVRLPVAGTRIADGIIVHFIITKCGVYGELLISPSNELHSIAEYLLELITTLL